MKKGDKLRARNKLAVGTRRSNFVLQVLPGKQREKRRSYVLWFTFTMTKEDGGEVSRCMGVLSREGRRVARSSVTSHTRSSADRIFALARHATIMRIHDAA